jgi:hypothetical protein
VVCRWFHRGCTRAREKGTLRPVFIINYSKVSSTIVARLADVLSAAEAFHPRSTGLSITLRHGRFPAHQTRPVSIHMISLWGLRSLKFDRKVTIFGLTLFLSLEMLISVTVRVYIAISNTGGTATCYMVTSLRTRRAASFTAFVHDALGSAIGDGLYL